MHFRTRILFAFWGLTISIAMIFGLLTIRTSREALFKEIQSNVLSIAASAAGQVNGELHEQIQASGDEDGEAYRQIERTLRKVRDLNRRDDIYVKFLYTMRPVPGDPDRWIYVVDAEEEGEDKSAIGELVIWEGQGEPGDEPLILGEAYADTKIAADPYGCWLSAYAPIKNAEGNPIAMLGADLRADDVMAKRDFILYTGLIGLATAISIGAVLSIFLSGWATRPLRQIATAVRKLGMGHLDVRLPVERRDEFGEVATAFNEMADSLQERDALKGALSRYVSQDIGNRLIEEGKLQLLRGDRREVTVLFCRSENIVKLAEKFPPTTTIDILNHFTEKMVDIIFTNHGTLDRIDGSALIAVFGAPLDDDEKERNAIQAAIQMQAVQDEVNAKWGLSGETQFRVDVGLHSGAAIIGNVGSHHRVEFTVVGDTVDMATRIEGLNSKYRTTGLVSETVAEKGRQFFQFREVGDVQCPGRIPNLIRLYTLSQFAKAH